MRKEHPAFIWQDIDKYPNKIFNTVNTSLAIKRLSMIAGVPLGENYVNTINSCRVLRNTIEHYEFNLDIKEAKGIIGRMVSLIFEFSKHHLDLNLEEEFRQDNRWKGLIDIYEFREAHSSIIEKQLKEDNKIVWECPSCGAKTFDIEQESCGLCGHQEQVVKCEICHEKYFESDTDEVMDVDYDEEGPISADRYRICYVCRDEAEKGFSI